MKLAQGLLAAGFSLCVASANAGVITHDFDGFADGTDISGVEIGYTTISASNGVIVTGGAIGNSSSYRADFDMFGVIAVSIDLADSLGGLDGLFLQAYDNTDTLLGSSTATASSATLDLFAPSISYVEFGGLGGAEVYGDNLSVTSIDVGGSGFGTLSTPLPAALPLMASALAGVMYCGRRARNRK